MSSSYTNNFKLSKKKPHTQNKKKPIHFGVRGRSTNRGWGGGAYKSFLLRKWTDGIISEINVFIIKKLHM